MDKKKIAIIGAAAVVLIGIIVGIVIGVNSGKEPEKPEEKPAVVDEKSFEINGLKFKLDTEKEFEGLKYEISKDFAEAKHDLYTHYVEYRYLQDNGEGKNLLFFRVFHYTDKDTAAAVKDLGIEGEVTFTDGKTNGVDYKLCDEGRDDGTVHFYFIEKDNDTYVLHLASQYDVKEFETKVLKTIKF